MIEGDTVLFGVHFSQPVKVVPSLKPTSENELLESKKVHLTILHLCIRSLAS